jgi:hypothetical protein
VVSFPQFSPTKTLYTSILSAIHATCIIFGEQYRSESSAFFNFLHSTVPSSLLGPNFLLSTLFLNTLSIRSSLNVSDQVSQPYRTAGQIIVLYILIFKFRVVSKITFTRVSERVLCLCVQDSEDCYSHNLNWYCRYIAKC